MQWPYFLVWHGKIDPVTFCDQYAHSESSMPLHVQLYELNEYIFVLPFWQICLRTNSYADCWWWKPFRLIFARKIHSSENSFPNENRLCTCQNHENGLSLPVEDQLTPPPEARLGRGVALASAKIVHVLSTIFYFPETPPKFGGVSLCLHIHKETPPNFGTNLMEVGAFQTKVNTKLSGDSWPILSVWKAREAFQNEN